ncbi:MAG: PH domain-containing protein [Gemmataceae bacterium]
MKDLAHGIPRNQETSVWWGGYAARTMLPSLSLSILLTGGIIWWAWTYLQRADIQLAVLSASGIVWVVQTLRFGNRFFGYNYHLTTRRVVQDWGILNKGMRTLLLCDVERIDVERSPLETLLGVGRVILRPRDAQTPPMVWSGVRNCDEAAERVRAVWGRIDAPSG